MKTILTLILIIFIILVARLFTEVAIYEVRRYRIRKRNRETEADKKRHLNIYG